MINKLRLRPEVIFQPATAGRDLGRESVRSGMTAIATQGAQFVLSVVSTIVLARILSPNDYGLIGMVSVILGFAQMFANAGLSMATIQEEHITPEQISTLFWINFMISTFLGLCILICSPLIALFYDHPELTGVTAALSFSFIISGAIVQHQALLYRHLRFGALAIIQVVSQAVGMSVAIGLALLGWRYWALVISSIIGTLFTIFSTFLLCPWVPGCIRRSAKVRSMLTFGGNVSVSNIANYFSLNMDSVLIGRFIGSEALGLYSKAYQLFVLPITQLRSPVVSVALPVLSSLRGDPERYARYFQLIVGTLATVTVPLSLYCAIEAEFLIRAFLGQHWLEAIPVFRILALAGLMYPFNGIQAMVTMNMGFSSRFAYLGLANAVLYLTAFGVGLPFGIEGVAAGFTSATCIIGFVSAFYCFRDTPVSARQFISAQVPASFTGVLALCGLLMAQQVWPTDGLTDSIARFVVFWSICVGISLCRESVRQTLALIIRKLVFSSEKGM